MYFYIIAGPKRTGFGITQDYTRREKDYTGAWGYPAEFTYIFEGPSTHIRRLENVIKQMNQELLWHEGEWVTEWLDNQWTPAQLLEFVLAEIALRHLKLTQVR